MSWRHFEEEEKEEEEEEEEEEECEEEEEEEAEEEGKRSECPICLERLDERKQGVITVLPCCRTRFHSRCLMLWFSTSIARKKNAGCCKCKCPICRSSIGLQDCTNTSTAIFPLVHHLFLLALLFLAVSFYVRNFIYTRPASSSTGVC